MKKSRHTNKPCDFALLQPTLNGRVQEFLCSSPLIINPATSPLVATGRRFAVHRNNVADFEGGPWGRTYSTIVQSWRCVWEYVVPLFAFPPDVRRTIYTTNAIESLHM